MTMLRAGPVDIHCHVAPAELPPAPAGEPRWPCMVCGPSGVRTVKIEGQPFRELDERSWAPRRRLEDMDASGVAVQVLSPMPELLSYWFASGAALQMCETINAAIAEMVSAEPARFRGLGAIPMQDTDAAISTMRGLKERFGLDGFEIGSNILGEPLGATRFEPIYEAAQDLGLSIFIHALHPIVARLSAPALGAPLTTFAGFPLDTGLAGASLLLAGVPARFPRLRIALGHGGGALGSMLGRLDTGWTFSDGYGGQAPELPSVQARRMYFDSNVYDPAYLKYLAEEMAPGQVLLGTDYPYAIMQADPIRYARSAGLSPAALDSLLSGAAGRFLA